MKILIRTKKESKIVRLERGDVYVIKNEHGEKIAKIRYIRNEASFGRKPILEIRFKKENF